MEQADLYSCGQVIGRIAFKEGRTSAAAMDKSAMNFIGENCREVGSSIPFLKGWNDGWHTANLGN